MNARQSGSGGVKNILKTHFGSNVLFIVTLTRQKKLKERERNRSLLYFPYEYGITSAGC